MQYNYSDFDFIFNPYTLNIFTDASMNRENGCYGAIAVCMDNIIETQCFPRANTTNNQCELLGIKLALGMIIKYINSFRCINIFSDSMYATDSINIFIKKWRFDSNKLNYITSSGNIASNQNIIVEIYELYNSLLLYNPNINILHVPAHIENKKKSMAYATKSYTNLNKLVKDIPDEELIKYICKYNNLIDTSTRTLLEFASNYYTLPISIIPHQI